jgi:hypothetical protein
VVLAGLNSRSLISPSREPTIDIVSCLLLAAALYGIWRLKKWGAYLVLLRLGYTIVVQVVVYQSLSWQLIGSYSGHLQRRGRRARSGAVAQRLLG